MIDLDLAQKNYSQICKRKYAAPIYLRPGMVTVPLRARKARIKDDGTRAYLLKDKIRNFLPWEEGSKVLGTCIVFIDDSRLQIPNRWSGVRDILAAAELVEQEGIRLNGFPKEKSTFLTRENPGNYRCRGCPRRGTEP